MAHVSGQGGNVLVDGAHTLNVVSWEGEDTTETDDVTDTGDSGFGRDVATIRRLTGTVTGKWDTATSWIATAGIVAQAEVTLKLNIGNTGKFYQCTALITSVPVANPAKGAVTIGFSFRSQGSITVPVA